MPEKNRWLGVPKSQNSDAFPHKKSCKKNAKKCEKRAVKRLVSWHTSMFRLRNMLAKRRKTLINRDLAIHPTGFEPVTFGSVDRPMVAVYACFLGFLQDMCFSCVFSCIFTDLFINFDLWRQAGDGEKRRKELLGFDSVPGFPDR